MSSLFSAKRRRPRLPSGVRVYAVGDVHGRADLLAQVHSRIDTHLAQNPASRAIEVYVGDYVDRGPESRRVIDLLIARQPGRETVFLKGNHEAFVLQFLTDPKILDVWRQLGGLQTLSSYGVEPPTRAGAIDCKQLAAAFSNVLPYAHARFLSELKTSFTCGDFFFVHGGVQPGVSLDRQKEDDLLGAARDGFLRTDEDFGKYIVHGHTSVEEPDIRPNRLNIDTGAFATGRLTCVAIEGGSLQFLSDGVSSLAPEWLEIPGLEIPDRVASTQPIDVGISNPAPASADHAADGQGEPAAAGHLPAARATANQIISREASARSPGRSMLRPIAAVASALVLVVAISTLTVSRIVPKAGTDPAGASADALASGTAVNNFGAHAVDVGDVDAHLVVQQELSASGNVDLQLGARADVQNFGLVLEIVGLPQGMTISAGRPVGAVGWRIPVADAAGAVIHPPQGFAGTVDLVVELRRADDTIADVGMLHREWKPNVVSASAAVETPTTTAAPADKVAPIDSTKKAAANPPPKPEAASADKVAPIKSTEKAAANPPQKPEAAPAPAAGPQKDRAYIDFLVARGEKLMAEGDIQAARTLLQRAAESRDAHAALALGATYDPVMLTIVRARGITPDVELARYWYKKASELGSAEAQQRLNSLSARTAETR